MATLAVQAHMVAIPMRKIDLPIDGPESHGPYCLKCGADNKFWKIQIPGTRRWQIICFLFFPLSAFMVIECFALSLEYPNCAWPMVIIGIIFLLEAASFFFLLVATPKLLLICRECGDVEPDSQ